MSIFGSIMEKIFHHGGQPAAAASAPPAPSAPAAGVGAPAAAAIAPAAAPAAPAQPIDVEAVLTQMAEQKGDDGLNWRQSIVDLLKLLDLDASLPARKELANELNVHVSEDGSAEENIALHKAVMQKLAENGGKVPAGLS